jgi:hypothetical protein
MCFLAENALIIEKFISNRVKPIFLPQIKMYVCIMRNTSGNFIPQIYRQLGARKFFQTTTKEQKTSLCGARI